jgi:hypothetical protein
MKKYFEFIIKYSNYDLLNDENEISKYKEMKLKD